MKDILAVIGALCVAVTAGVLLLAWLSHRTEQHHSRRRRDERARRPPEKVITDPAMWADYFVDHDLHHIETPKEWQ
ncbi:hypothetical protein AB0B45_02590 [Nonomuraea sp. NPDC049152]|uniref:hypothetical protein n=1 Tax=Nonomuraea sp. NPDC049152 TaxID=3154350 RepID=UPI0033DF7463